MREERCMGIDEEYFSEVREAHSEPGGEGSTGPEDAMNLCLEDLYFCLLSRTGQGTPYRESIKADETNTYLHTYTEKSFCVCE